MFKRLTSSGVTEIITIIVIIMCLFGVSYLVFKVKLINSKPSTIFRSIFKPQFPTKCRPHSSFIMLQTPASSNKFSS